MRQALITALILAGTNVPLASLAQETSEIKMPEGCSVTSQSEWIRLVHCSNALEDADYAMAGRAACGAKTPCGAWIWMNMSDMPLTAPDNHDGLNQAQVTSSIGVWVAEKQSLIRIGR